MVRSLSRVRLFETPWMAAYQAPPPMGFSRQECWSGVPLPSPRLPIYKDAILTKETGISGNFVGRIKGAKWPFDLQFLTWDFS